MDKTPTQHNFIIVPLFTGIWKKKNFTEETAKVSVIEQLREVIGTLRPTVTPSTHKNRVTAVNTLERFFQEEMPDREVVTAGSITADTIKAFERWSFDQNYKANYVAQNMSNLRKLMKEVRSDGGELFSLVRTSNCQAEKKAVSEETIKKIREAQLASARDILAKDIFLFCFFCMGMPLIDAVFLKKSQLEDGYITYFRHKTHRKVKVKIIPELMEVIERLTADGSQYLLPVLTTENQKEAMRQYRRFYQRYRRALGRISVLLGLDGTLTSYTPRHSWASVAYRNSIDLNTIARALGHANTNVTMTYIREIEDCQLTSANRIVCDAIQ